ncbi:MAG: leucine-rich repeat protein, partial [Lachnospiraceae bacterium]|nr:leucine-rich repeat protein [Lachnospiraceae bacterium]
LEENQNYYFYVCGYVIINTDKGEIPEFSDRSDILSVNMSAPTPTPQVTNSPKPEITPTPAPLVTPEPTETPAPTPSASPESGIKDKKAGSFIITDAVNSYISFSWSAVDGAEEYELSYSNTPNGERIPLRRISASETYCRNIEVTGAMFNVRENINVTDVQAYGQTRNEERYYFIRAVAKGEYSQYSDYVKVALHTEQLMAPDATPTPAPNPSPTLSPGTDDDGYTVGSKKKIGKLIYRITAKSNSAMTVEVVRPVKKTYKSVTIPATVKIGGKEYKVTSVKASAFLKNKKLARIVFGKNIRKIGRKSFYGCRKLMNITFKTKNVKSFGKKAFHGITMKCRFIIPKKVLAKYKKLIRKTEG